MSGRWPFIAMCGLSLLPLVWVTYPPAIDLAQHGGQITMALHYGVADRHTVLSELSLREVAHEGSWWLFEPFPR